jgi:transposase
LYYVVGLDLTEIEGISELTALTVISEIGPGVSRFATVKKFCSWGCAPTGRRPAAGSSPAGRAGG